MPGLLTSLSLLRSGSWAADGVSRPDTTAILPPLLPGSYPGLPGRYPFARL